MLPDAEIDQNRINALYHSLLTAEDPYTALKYLFPYNGLNNAKQLIRQQKLQILELEEQIKQISPKTPNQCFFSEESQVPYTTFRQINTSCFQTNQIGRKHKVNLLQQLPLLITAPLLAISCFLTFFVDLVRFNKIVQILVLISVLILITLIYFDLGRFSAVLHKNAKILYSVLAQITFYIYAVFTMDIYGVRALNKADIVEITIMVLVILAAAGILIYIIIFVIYNVKSAKMRKYTNQIQCKSKDSLPNNGSCSKNKLKYNTKYSESQVVNNLNEKSQELKGINAKTDVKELKNKKQNCTDQIYCYYTDLKSAFVKYRESSSASYYSYSDFQEVE